ALPVFASKIVFERAISGTQETQPVPATIAGVRSQGREIGCRDNREVDVLGNVVSDSVYAVDPSSAHRTRLDLTFSVHQLIKHQRPPRRAEQFAQPDGSRWCIA